MSDTGGQRDRRDGLPVPVQRNPNAANPLPESPWLCPVCGDSHLRGMAGERDYPGVVFTCGNGHDYGDVRL